ncbi:MAG TPA: hemerythrin domain-containing protein [Aggregicoccus sp.]|nr:hemerythrin domain-containing protein [Aggregicoccus sp.]
MLVSLRFDSSCPAVAGGPIAARLLECHERIRRFTAMATRLAGALGAPATEVVEAARQLRRYFSMALPLHVADEDGTVMPRLLAAGPDEPLRAALQQMESEHLLIDALLPTQLEAWARLEAQPALLPKLASTLAQGAALLEDALGKHLELEERVIIPALDLLLPRELQLQMVEEMKARRGVQADAQS